MDKISIITAILEAQRFIEKAHKAKEAIDNNHSCLITGSKETAACRRASLDLTRALAQMRK